MLVLVVPFSSVHEYDKSPGTFVLQTATLPAAPEIVYHVGLLVVSALGVKVGLPAWRKGGDGEYEHFSYPHGMV